MSQSLLGHSQCGFRAAAVDAQRDLAGDRSERIEQGLTHRLRRVHRQDAEQSILHHQRIRRPCDHARASRLRRIANERIGVQVIREERQALLSDSPDAVLPHRYATRSFADGDVWPRAGM